jgi:hypothetical protein
MMQYNTSQYDTRVQQMLRNNVSRNVMQCSTSDVSTQASNVLAADVWLTAEVTQPRRPESVHCVASLINAPARTAGPR